MITPTGYSKDPNIKAESIVVTLPVAFFENRGAGIQEFKKMFVRYMAREDALWNFRLTNLPTTNDIGWVYLIFDKRIQFQCNFVQYERGVCKTFKDSPDGKERHFHRANWVILTGPAIPPPPGSHWYENPKRGFQGFQYATKLW